MTSLNRVFELPGADATRQSDSAFAQQVSRRLAIVALLLSALTIFVLLLKQLVPELATLDEHGTMHTGNGPLLISLVISSVVGVSAWRRRIPTTWIIPVGVLYPIFICWEVTVGSTLLGLRTTGEIPTTTFCEVLIVFFPLMMPMRPLVTAITAVASAAMRVPAALIASSAENVPLEAGWVLRATIAPAVAVLLAVTGSVVVFGLRRQAQRARQVGSYRLEKLIGKGGMGEVWQARHQMLARPAAIKFVRNIPSEQLAREQALERFEREVLATSKLKSPHTVEVYDYGQAEDGSFFYVMELLDGINLQQLVDRFGAVVPERAVYFALQICRSLSEAHTLGLVHRDIKPSNLLACRFGLALDHIKVVDFGLVGATSRLGSDAKLSGENQTIGTPAFISPEAARAESIDHRADIYGIGCVLYWLIAGRLVFEGETGLSMAVAHASKQPEPLAEASEWEISEELAALVHRCLAKERSERPQSVAELATGLSALEFGDPWDPRRASRWWKRHRPLEIL